jgi:hypothetical protein
MKYRFIGQNARGSVTFAWPKEPSVVMPTGEPVEVPAWLAPKLATHGEFEAVPDATVHQLVPKRRGRPPRKAVSDDPSAA